MNKKITVVGAGNVGASAAQRILAKGLGDVVLVDVVEGLAQGKALDLMQAAPLENYRGNISGTTSYEESANSSVVIITAGIARKPGMSRDDLLNINKDIVGGVAQQVARFSPQAVLIVVSNPLDAMCHVALGASGFSKKRVVGMAGVLDTARYRAFLAAALGINPSEIQAMVLGGHGDTMVPLTGYTTIAGIQISSFLGEAELRSIEERTRNGGAEIVSLLKTGSAFYAPASSAVLMAEAIISDSKRVLPCSALLEGEYGLNGIFMGVPVLLGAGGVESIIELTLSPAEKEMLSKSAQSVAELVAKLKG
ncbi:MAG: malate dehydrogenase [Deltaproteobacteria bacterium]|nr:malate dehydrogenase [Deltaproteobacteria bacterium]